MAGAALPAVNDEPKEDHGHVAKRQTQKEWNRLTIGIGAAEAREERLGQPAQENRSPERRARIGQSGKKNTRLRASIMP